MFDVGNSHQLCREFKGLAYKIYQCICAVLTGVEHSSEHPALAIHDRLPFFRIELAQNLHTACPGCGCSTKAEVTTPATYKDPIIIHRVDLKMYRHIYKEITVF